MLLATGYKAENIKEYRYFDNGTNSLDFDGMRVDLEVTWLSIHVSGQIKYYVQNIILSLRSFYRHTGWW